MNGRPDGFEQELERGLAEYRATRQHVGGLAIDQLAARLGVGEAVDERCVTWLACL